MAAAATSILPMLGGLGEAAQGLNRPIAEFSRTNKNGATAKFSVGLLDMFGLVMFTTMIHSMISGNNNKAANIAQAAALGSPFGISGMLLGGALGGVETPQEAAVLASPLGVVPSALAAAFQYFR